MSPGNELLNSCLAESGQGGKGRDVKFPGRENTYFSRIWTKLRLCTIPVVQSDWSVGSSADVVAVIATLAAMTTDLITTCLSTDKEIPSQC